MALIDRKLKGLIIDDHSLFRSGLQSSITQNLKSEIEEFEDGYSAVRRLIEASDQNHELDFVITDINHAKMDGVEFIQKVRALSDKRLYYNGLKIKHIPIVVLTMLERSDIRENVNKLSKEIIFLNKNTTTENVLHGIVKSIATYRKEIVEEFTNQGYSIQFENGQYKISNNFSLAPKIKTKYFSGVSDEANKAMTRAILIQNASGIGKVSLSLFEGLLNNPKTSEKDLQDFFRLFPEFLLDGNYDILHSERVLKNAGKNYRTDIIAQPRGLIHDSDKWALIELKKHSENILTNKKYHTTFSKTVYNAIVQLKNYQLYFNDPQNAEEIKKKFGGVLPNPRLSLIIGRTPKDKMNIFTQMKTQFPEISITTYDEVLNFRKIQVQFMESLGL